MDLPEILKKGLAEKTQKLMELPKEKLVELLIEERLKHLITEIVGDRYQILKEGIEEIIKSQEKEAAKYPLGGQTPTCRVLLDSNKKLRGLLELCRRHD